MMTMEIAFNELADFCQKSDTLTLSLLREKLEGGLNNDNELIRGNLSEEVDDDTTLLHYVCYNRHVTLDIVQYLVSLYPEAIEVVTDRKWLPLHRACNNPACPDNVVEYLISLYPEALSVSWPHAGLPLHCLLSRHTREDEPHPLNLNLVRKLVEAYPEALINQDNHSTNSPLMCAVGREDVSLDLVRLLVDPELLVLGMGGGYNEGDIPFTALMEQYHSTEGWRAPFDVIQFFHRVSARHYQPPCVDKNLP